MSLTEIKLWDVVKRQYFYKLKANVGLFFSMLLVQLAALSLSIFSGGVGSFGMGSEGISISVKVFSGDIILIFTLIWVFLTARLFATDPYRNIDFSFISNRLSSNLANIAFILTASVAGGVTATLSSVLFRVIAYFYISSQNIIGENFLVAPQDLVVGIVASTLYLFLCSALGYFFGILTQLNKSFAILLPTVFFGTLFIEARMHDQAPTFIKIIQLFTNESSFGLFFIKVVITVVILFYSVILMSDRLEVRR